MLAPSKSNVFGCLLIAGSALCLNASASAGLVWDFANSNNYFDVIFGAEDPFVATGSAAMSAVSSSLGSDSVSVTAATPTGFSASMIQASGGGTLTTVGRFFSVSGSVDIAISGISTSDVTWRIYDHANLDAFNNPTVVLQIDVSSGAVYSETLTLAAGQYAVELIGSADADSTYSGTFGTFAIVPGPGAMALVGIAGLAGRRRRA